jgi:hypothetical protein
MRVLRWGEVAIGAALTAVALWLHSMFFRSAGPLWRDEIVSLHVAQTPFAHLLQRMQFDSYPAFWLLLLRAWVSLFGAASLRLFGLLVAVALLGAIWFAVRTLGVRAPMLAIAMGGAAAAMVRFGDSIRAYGFSVVIGLVSLTLLYRTVIKPTRASFALALLAALASVHTTYYNAVLLFACCVAAAIAHRNRQRAIAILGIGAVCALSMLIYIPTIRAVGRWSDLTRYELDLPWIAKKFGDAVDLGGGAGQRAWLIALIAALGLAGVILARRRDHSALVFCTTTLVLFTVAQIAFLLVLRYLMQPWYFLLWIGVAAALLDVMIAIALDREPALQLVRAGAAFFILLVALDGTRELASRRATDMDRVAATIAHDGTPRDFVIVYPWHFGVSFNEYYRGAAPWQTLPPIDDQSVQRYDEAKRAITDMRERSTIARAAATLRDGGRVWYVGEPLYLEKRIYVESHANTGGMAAADARWSGALESALRASGAKPVVVKPPDSDVSEYEQPLLLRFER